MTADIIAKAKKGLEAEILASATYRYLAASYPDKNTRDTFSDILHMEDNHLHFWQQFLNRRGVDTKGFKPAASRLMLYRLMFRLLGKGLTLRVMEISENQAIELYSSMEDDPHLSEEERQSLGEVLGDELVHEHLLVKEETKFEGVITHIKDAVLGMSDGLVEILSVTTGLAGVSGSPSLVALGGLVVGVAGALSMAASTYTSTRAQRQVHESIINRISSAARFVASVFKDRVSEHMEKQGYSRRLAAEMAEESAKDPRLIARFITEQEYGLREEGLGNPSRAALFAGVSNLIGAFLPLIPYFFAPDILTAMLLSLVFASVALAITGFFVSILAYMSPGKKIGEMLLSGLGSAAITYFIGKAASIFLGTNVQG